MTENILDTEILKDKMVETTILFPTITEEPKKLALMNEVLAYVDNFLKTDLKEFIWYKNQFRLRLTYNEGMLLNYYFDKLMLM